MTVATTTSGQDCPRWRRRRIKDQDNIKITNGAKARWVAICVLRALTHVISLLPQRIRLMTCPAL